MSNEKSQFENLFRPRSIAIIGASAKRGSARNTLVRIIVKHGFKGEIYPVSPSSAEVEGLKAYASVDELPAIPDLALIITPAETVPEIVAACGGKGIRAAIVFSDVGDFGLPAKPTSSIWMAWLKLVSGVPGRCSNAVTADSVSTCW